MGWWSRDTSPGNDSGTLHAATGTESCHAGGLPINREEQHRMKIRPEHLDHMKTAIDAVLVARPNLVAEYQAGNFPRADKCKNVQVRFCFDLSYMAGLSRFTCDTLYEYLNDTHIYTALKHICPKVSK